MNENSNENIEALVYYIQTVLDNKQYGKIIISYEAGQISHIREEISILGNKIISDYKEKFNK